MINTKDNNNQISETIDLTTKWHYERNLIEGASKYSQTGKLFEEFIEIVAAQLPEKSPETIYDEVLSMLDDIHRRGRIKTVKAKETDAAFQDAIGDMIVVQINLAERENLTLAECLEASYGEIEHRKGKMINGQFVKEEDLIG